MVIHALEAVWFALSDADAEAEARSQIIAAGVLLDLAAEARRLQRQAQDLLIEAVPDSEVRRTLLTLLKTDTPCKD